MMTTDDTHSRLSIYKACTTPDFWKAAREKATVQRALRVAAVVGTILIAINQGDKILAGEFLPLWKLVLTYCVPYSVSTYSAASFKVSLARKKQ